MRVCFRFFGQSSTHRVEMNVAEQLEEILVSLAYDRLVSALEHMADFAVAKIKILGVGLLESLHKLGQRRPAALNQQVDMVGHKTKSVDQEIVTAPVARQPFQISLVVTIVVKGLSPLVAAHDDVVEQTRGQILAGAVPCLDQYRILRVEVKIYVISKSDP